MHTVVSYDIEHDDLKKNVQNESTLAISCWMEVGQHVWVCYHEIEVFWVNIYLKFVKNLLKTWEINELLVCLQTCTKYITWLTTERQNWWCENEPTGHRLWWWWWLRVSLRNLFQHTSVNNILRTINDKSVSKNIDWRTGIPCVRKGQNTCYF